MTSLYITGRGIKPRIPQWPEFRQLCPWRCSVYR